MKPLLKQQAQYCILHIPKQKKKHLMHSNTHRSAVFCLPIPCISTKKSGRSYAQKIESGDDLLSRAVASQVPSAC